MKKTILYIVLVLIICTLIMYLMSKNNKTGNGFTRNIITTKISLESAIDLHDRSFGFLGQPDTSIKFYKMLDQLHVFETHYSLKKLDTIALKLPSNFENKGQTIYKDALRGSIYFCDSRGNISIIKDNKTEYYKFNGSSIDAFQVVSANRLVTRIPNKKDGLLNRSLAKLRLSPDISLVNEYRLPDAVNGFFYNDGMLLYDHSTFKIFYMYFYRGEILTLDSNLNFQQIIKTIDTISTTNIKTALIRKEGEKGKSVLTVTTTAPPKFINAYITTNQNKLYAYSLLKASNETDTDFEQNQSIDVYDIKNGKYLYSFHIPKYKGQKLRQFKVIKNRVLAIYETFLVIYFSKQPI